MTPAERIAQLDAENGRQREQIAVLVARMQELEGRLAKDSHNSSKSPPSDGLARKTRSLRKRSGKKPGGQIGHHGETLRLVAVPDDVVEHHPARCTACQAPLDEDAPVVARERRQVHELPALRLQITEHQALHVRCPTCHAVGVVAFPAEGSSRAQYGLHLCDLAVYLLEQQLIPYARVRHLLADLFSAAVSLGTLVRWIGQAAETLRPVEERIAAALRRAAVLHNYETGVRQAGRLAWAHVASTARLTPLCHPSQTGQRGDPSHWHPRELHGGERP
jgi:transposase